MRVRIPLRTALLRLLLAGGNAALAPVAAFSPLPPHDRSSNSILLCDQRRLRGRFTSTLSPLVGRSCGGIHGNNPKLTTAMTPPSTASPRRATALSVIRDPTDRSSFLSDSDDPSKSEDPRTSIKSLLTQRSLTTLIYLLNTCNDSITSSWLESEFLDTSNQLEFHGTGAGYLERFGGWENVVLELMDCTVVRKRVRLGSKFRGGGGGGGGSGANSYLKDLEGESGSGGTSASSDSSPASSSAASAGPPPKKKKNYSPFGSSPKSSSTAADAASNASELAMKKEESFSPFGSPASKATSTSPASEAQGGGGGTIQRLGAGSSYLDSIAGASGTISSSSSSSSSRSSSSVDNISSKDDGADTDTKASGDGGNGEAFQRALLTARLGMERKAKDTASAKVGDNNKDAEEAFHRSLLAARLEVQTKSRHQRQLHHQFEAARLKANQEENDRRILAREKQRAESNRLRLAEDRERSLRKQEETNSNVRSDDEEYYIEIEIDPLSLATRLLAVREQIALEFVEDLTLIFKADEKLIAEILARSSRDELKEHEDEDEDEDATTSLPDTTINKDDGKKSSTISDTSSTTNDEELYERTAVRMHQEKMAYLATGKSSSPFRKGNFDLLYNLCTQASVHRLLRQLMADECNLADGADCTATSSDKTKIRDYNEASFRWLRDFYVDRVSDYFDGDVRFGRADDFFEEWTRQPPALISDVPSAPSSSASNKGGLDYVQPMRLAEEMVRIRSDIVMEWRRSMRMVPEEDHGWLRLVMMEKRMANSDDSASGGGKDKGGISDNGGGLDDDFTDEFGLEGFQ